MEKIPNAAQPANFLAWIHGGWCEEELPMNLIPNEFVVAKNIYIEYLNKKNSPQNIKNTELEVLIKSACDLLAPFLSCSFRPDNMSVDPSDILLVPEQTEAKKIKISHLHFKKSGFPIVSASAKFQFRSANIITAESLNEWQIENDFLYEGLSFSWSIPESDTWYPLNWEDIGMDFVGAKKNI